MSEVRRESASGHDIGRLADSYDIQSELHRGRATVSYLARHREHGRDVTLTVLDAATPAERNALTHLAADSRLLSTTRHPHVVPVVETRWLAANRLAVARARVRGATVRQALEGVGPMPEARVVEVLEAVGDVLDWAARAGIVHRHVDSDCVCFLKGNGKVMVSFGLPASLEGEAARGADDAAFLFERCADGVTLARLGYEMLTAHRAADASVQNLRAVRPDLSPRVLDAIEAGLRCDADSPAMDARQFITVLTGKAPAIGAAAIATAASAPVVPRAAASPLPPPQLPLGGPTVGNPSTGHATFHPASVSTGAPAYGTRRKRGRGLFIASMLGLVLLIGGTFWLISRDRDARDATRVAAADAKSEDAGDVEVQDEVLPPDPGGLTTDAARPSDSAPGILVPPSAGAPVPMTPDSMPAAVPPATTPAPAPTPQPRPRNVCDSPDPADQRACLSQRIESNDRELTSVYQALVRAVDARDGAPAVESLRSQQRAWLAQRDRQCRDAGSGELWARERASCFAAASSERALELARALAAVRNAPPR